MTPPGLQAILAGMRPPPANGLLLGPAILLVLVFDGARWIWLNARAALERWEGHGRIAWLKARIGRLPPLLALPLFLVPEICSRCGWIASAWLLLQGRGKAALLTYVTTKVVAGLTALWIFRACEPALMKVRWFAAAYHAGIAATRAMRAKLLPEGSRWPIFVRARRVLDQRRGE